MPQISIGDLAQSFMLRRQGTLLKQQMNRLTGELSSGRAADLNRHLSGSFAFLADIENDLTVQASYRTAATEAQFTAAAMQSALDHVQTLTVDLAETAVTAGTVSGDVANLGLLAEQGRNILGSIIGALNTQVAGRAVFAGNAVTSVPLATDQDLLTALRAALAGAVTATDVRATLDAFFDTAGGGFETLIYQGATTALAPMQLGEGESVALDLRADNTAIRAVLKETALAALLDDPALTLTAGEDTLLATSLGEGLFSAQGTVTGIRADLGFAEGRVDYALARTSAQITSLELARSELVSVDPFETATELENVQLQIETLYTLTARTSRLSLVNFLS